MNFISIFDVLGPNMIGPSSSHTAGACSMALLAKKLFLKEIKKVTFTLYGSFAKTYKGHGTDKALLGGILGFNTDDIRIRDAFNIAKSQGLEFSFVIDEETIPDHPNTADILMESSDGTTQFIRGQSIGGGKVKIVKIGNIDVDFTGEYSTLIVKQIDTPGVVAHLTRCLSHEDVNIAFMRLFREAKGQIAYTIIESDEQIPDHILDELKENKNILGTTVIQCATPEPKTSARKATPSHTINKTPGHILSEAPEVTWDFISGKSLEDLCQKNSLSISDAMEHRELSVGLSSHDNIDLRLSKILEIMNSSTHDPITCPQKSIGGLIGGEGKKVANSHLKSLCGSVLTKAISYAMSVLEVNGTMGLIVAAPTAGSSGVLPGCLLAVGEDFAFTEDKIKSGLLNASALGYIMMRNASVSGAEAGCQAEVGAASAMAASALTELFGGTPKMCLTAASLAISNLLGMVCDPIAGLVESPCQSRNAIGVSNAFTCSQLALSGITHPIPFDEMVEAMYKVGRSLPFELRETALGGNAGTPTGCSLCCL